MAIRPRPRITPAIIAATRPFPGGIFGPWQFDFVGNLFEANRPGRAIVRPDDLLALRIEWRNLTVDAGPPARLRHSGSGTGYLILHFPPQAITEETFFETRPAGTKNPEDDPETAPPNPNHQPKPEPAGSEPLRTPPVRARIANESRLVFRVPADFDIAYNLEAVLEACQQLAMSVAANARPRRRRVFQWAVDQLFVARALNAMNFRQRAALASYVVRSLRIGVAQGDSATLAMRQRAAGPVLRAIDTRIIGRAVDWGIRVRPPRPAKPTATTTAIEMPWRLILSPHKDERWYHATAPASSPHTERTELWHSRLVAPDADGEFVRSPYEDPNRTVRAIWALTGEGSSRTMQSAWPNPADLPPPYTQPFRMPMDDFDRFQIAHLSSNFSVSGYAPEVVETNTMMLSALGGWLDSRGAWEPPGLSVEEWVHRASMARDHYVRVVYRGFLYPFGHRVSLVKVSERKFHNGARDDDGNATLEQVPGNTAYLRQRLFIVVRERERRYDDSVYANLRNIAGDVYFAHQFPFSSLRLLTQVTPNLDRPDTGASAIDGFGQRMFWPHVDGLPFKFQCVATDLDGRRVAFDQPLIFMDNTLACPRTYDPSSQKLLPAWSEAEANAEKARDEYASASDKNTADLKLQRVALAPSVKAGDTSVQVEAMVLGGETEKGNATLRNASDELNRPLFFPKVAQAEARIGAMAHLSGTPATNKLLWNAHYLEHGFDDNTGQVFADVADEFDMAKLDFSAQGDRSGGFVQPNLKPNALSRFAGPVMGDVGEFIDGKVPPGGGFPASIGDLPLPLIFGCIPLADIIEAVTDMTGTPERIPQFASEAGTQLESFVNGLARLYGFIAELGSKPGSIADAALTAYEHTLNDLIAQAQAYASAQVAPVEDAVTQLSAALTSVTSQLQSLIDTTIDTAPDLNALPAAIATAAARVDDLRSAANATVGGATLPSGLRQSLLSVCSQLDAFLGDLEALPTLVAQAKTVFAALDDIVGHPDQLGTLLGDAGLLQTRIDALNAALGPFKTTLASLQLLEGAPRKVVVDAITVVEEILTGAGALAQLVELLTGEELTIRLDWNPKISSWWLPGVSTSEDPIFRANDVHGFLVAVEAKVKKNGSSSPNISVVCGLKHFDLVLIAPASFMELNFEKIEFSVDSGAKMDVDVVLSDIKFVGVLSFVETLRDLIPLDGFSDPPYLDITAEGIDAGFTIGLPGITVGVMSLNNLSLGAGFTVPFIGQPLSVRFLFCEREQPFTLTVWMFGGGGFFGVTVDPQGVQILEAAFEFGASVSIDLGVASGGVEVMAGIYFRMEQDAASLTGYFRLGGHVDVLGLITASLELYLELRYEFETGKCVGKAQLTIEISVFVFSGSVTVTCERKFSGANGDPTLREMLGHRPELSLDDELALIDADTRYGWREHCEAFA